MPYSGAHHLEYGRCPMWKHRTFTVHLAVRGFEANLRSLGFQTRFGQNPGLYHVYYRLPWVEIKTFTNHAAAHGFKAWLESLGCERKGRSHRL